LECFQANAFRQNTKLPAIAEARTLQVAAHVKLSAVDSGRFQDLKGRMILTNVVGCALPESGTFVLLSIAGVASFSGRGAGKLA
jgi:hypothetical protein